MASKTPFRLTTPAGAGRRGFTAIEISAVATIIAILALILIPIVRKRVDESKVVAAQDDMIGIEKAELMAYGQTGHYFRLHDLDRPEPSQDDLTALNPADLANSQAVLKVPPGYWDRPTIQYSETNYLISNWKGPYMTFNRAQTLNFIALNYLQLIRTPDSAVSGALNGPLMIIKADDKDWTTAVGAMNNRRYPTDPWGNPYLFFGPGKISLLGGQTAVAEAELKDYSNAAIYSLGPDGNPGSLLASDPLSFFRETAELPANFGKGLGTGDDLKREF
jgi:prepilin-type N-terminal cleavage/methylation domain-containing protein